MFALSACTAKDCGIGRDLAGHIQWRPVRAFVYLILCVCGQCECILYCYWVSPAFPVFGVLFDNTIFGHPVCRMVFM